VIAGGIIGGLVGAFLAPSMRPEFRERVMQRGRDMRKKAEHLVRRAQDEVDEVHAR